MLFSHPLKLARLFVLLGSPDFPDGMSSGNQNGTYNPFRCKWVKNPIVYINKAFRINRNNK